jgi:hypothetical protein
MEKGDRYCCSRTEYHTDAQYFFCDVAPDGSPLLETQGRQESSSGDANPFGSVTIQEDIKPVCEDFRGIPAHVYKKYGCTMELSESDRSVEVVKYPVYESGKLVGYKKRIVKTKEFMFCSLT